MKSRLLLGSAMACALTLPATVALAGSNDPLGPNGPIKHIVVIYQENHSFDNLYGNWGTVGSDTVNGRSNAMPAQTIQMRQDGVTPYQCLLQQDVNLTSPPLQTTCTDNTGQTPFNSNFTNAPFGIDDFIPPSATTCPTPLQFFPNGILNGQGLAGGCTMDLIHRYYSEQYQLDHGKQDQYVTASDASGLSMGYYDSTQLPLYAYLHAQGAPNYVIEDNFFQGAFGGSFLNHQWLVAAATPIFAGAVNDGGSHDMHSVVDANGMPLNTPLYTSPLGSAVIDSRLSASCNPPPGRPLTPPGVTCGDFAVNTIQPYVQPYSPGTAPYKRLPPLTTETIGDRLNEAGVSWAWFSGGWSNADGDVNGPGWTNGSTPGSCMDPYVNPAAVYPYCPDGDFQFHHQAFNFYKTYAPGTAERRQHLRDEVEFISMAQAGRLPRVSFVKPLGENNEHPGYASETNGSSHLVDLLNAVLNGPDGKNTLVIITYDEFGGQWDHVSPPGQGNNKGPHDKWGPGTRIPAVLISKQFAYSGVDHTSHDTTSIAASLEHRFNLAPLSSRDARVLNLAGAVDLGFFGAYK